MEFYRTEAIYLGQDDVQRVFLGEGLVWPLPSAACVGIEPITNSSQLLAGTMEAGYAGEVCEGELFTASELAMLTGVDEGVAQNEDGGWLKFAWKGETIFIAKKTFRRSISYDHLAVLGLISGTVSINKDDKSFRVVLPTGAYDYPFQTTRNGISYTASNSCNANFGEGSMWNNLMYRVHSEVPVCSGSSSHHGGRQIGDNWASYNNSQLDITQSSWCQESNTSSTFRLYRGGSSLRTFALSSSSTPNRGWRPVLRLHQRSMVDASPIISTAQLIGGNLDAGYAGEVSCLELFTATELSDLLDVTDGVIQNNNTNWLKFAWKGETIFIAKGIIRRRISWDYLYSKGLVYGTDDFGISPGNIPTNQLKTVNKNGLTFRVQLPTGAYSDNFDTIRNGISLSSHDSCSANFGEGSMWNDLMYRMYDDIPNCSEPMARHGGSQIGGNWESFYVDDLSEVELNRGDSWCQEKVSNGTHRLSRRSTGPFTISLPSNFIAFGWRPVLVIHSS